MPSTDMVCKEISVQIANVCNTVTNIPKQVVEKLKEVVSEFQDTIVATIKEAVAQEVQRATRAMGGDGSGGHDSGQGSGNRPPPAEQPSSHGG